MSSQIFARLAGLARTRRYGYSSILAALLVGAPMAYAQQQALPLELALQLATQHSSAVSAAGASVEASRHALARAGQLPDPMLKLGIDNVPVSGAERWSTSRDSMTMRRIGIEQQLVSRAKRAARAGRALKAIDSEQATSWQALAKVRMDTANAWINLLYAQRTIAVMRAMEEQTRRDYAAVSASHRVAKASAGDVSAAEIAIAQAADQTQKSEQEVALAKVALSRWTGREIDTVAAEPPPMVSYVARMAPEALEQVHPAILSARAAVAVADADTAVARTERRPDWTVEAGFAQRPHYSNMVSFGVSIPLPINRPARQDRDVAERAALGTKARLLYEETVRDARADLLSLSTTLDSLNSRLATFRATALPAAEKQAALAIAAYRAGSGSLTAVFGARRTQLEVQVRAIELEREAALTWAQLEYHVLPHAMAPRPGSQP